MTLFTKQGSSAFPSIPTHQMLNKILALSRAKTPLKIHVEYFKDNSVLFLQTNSL